MTLVLKTLLSEVKVELELGIVYYMSKLLFLCIAIKIFFLNGKIDYFE